MGECQYYIILDNAMFVSPPDSLNMFRNQMHLLTHVSKRTGDWTGYIVLNQLPGVHLYTVTGPKKMYIAMGSSIDSTPAFDLSDQSITKLAWTPYDATIDTGLMQKLSMTASSDNNQENFITLLYPSESPHNVNPITEAIQDDSGYRLIATEGSRKVFVSLSSDSISVFPSENYRLDTDGDFLVLDTESDISSIHEMILSRGTELTVSPNQGTAFPAQDLFFSFTEGLDEVIASWKNGNLNVTFKTNQSLYPKYKIKRCEVLPSQFFSKTEFGMEVYTEIDTIASTRGTITDNVNTLAYDIQNFYVNYTWDDLMAAGLINDDLVIVKATIPEFSLNTDLNIQGIVSIVGTITINNGASMDIYPNSSVTIAEDVDIYNHGILTIDGGTSRSINISNANQLWSGITSYREGSLTCNNAIIEGAQTGISIRGNSSVSHCEITNCYTGIAIETGTTFSVERNSIYQNTQGILISNNQATISLGVVDQNDVTQNGVGVLIYNSNTKLTSNNILNNTRAGLHLIRESDPLIKDCNVSYTESDWLSRPEIRLESDSYPIIDDARNDINTDGLGYSLYYASTGRIEQMLARNNYWGCTDSLQIRDSIYPPLWAVVFDPFCLEPNTYIPNLEDNLFKQALQAEEAGDVELAKQLYTSIVVTEPDSLYALQCLGRLNSVYAGTPDLISELRSIYNAYALSCSDSLLIASAEVRSVMLDRFAMQYLQAIQGYEDLLQGSASELDSLLCLLDIAYTLEDIYYNDQGKGMYIGATYHSNGMHITSLKEARHTVDRIWGEILSTSDNTSIPNAPVPTKLDITNYPNPFNPSTTIAFSLPEEGIVRMVIYNIRGQQVKELIAGNMSRGFHKVIWDGRDNRSRSVSSGLYFVRIEVGKTSIVKKITMIK
jgi:parallel beta-helix repeat protein